MTSKSASESGNLSQDDAYWASLFQQEETIVEEDKVSPNGVKPEFWPPVLEDTEADDSPSESTQQDPWQIAQTFFEDEKSVSLTVHGFNKGGLLVQWLTLQGFVPASQLVDFPQFHLESERLQALKQWVGKTLELKIIELNQHLNRLIFSERAAQVRVGARDTLLNRISAGDRLTGEVTNLTKFGAFVDLGGVEGLIHISELSWSRVLHPSDVVQPGKSVRVLVLSVDADNGRIALSLKQLKQDPWKTVSTRFKPGQLVEGIVSNIVSYGAFIMIEEELEGLVHISELAEGNFLHPRNVVRKGERVVAKVINVDGKAKRLALTMRGVPQDTLSDQD